MSPGHRIIIAICLAAAAAAAESPLRIAAADPLLRGDSLFRCLIVREVDADQAARGPLRLHAELVRGSIVVSSLDLPIERLAQLRRGVRVMLAVSRLGDSDEPARLMVSLSDAARGQVERADQAVETAIAAKRELDRLFARMRAIGTQDPLPCLWLEQGAALCLAGDSIAHHRALVALDQRLAKWLDGAREKPEPGTWYDGAWRDAVDASVLPYRLLLPTAAPGAIAVLMRDYERTPAKERWDEPPAAWATAALAAGIALVDCYPAGDITWSGMGPRRASAALAAARAQWTLQDAPAVVVGVGPGAGAALAIAEQDPAAWRALALVDLHLDPLPAASDGMALWLWMRGHGGARLVQLSGVAIGVADDLTGTPVQRVDNAAMIAPPDTAQFWRWLADSAARPPMATTHEAVLLEPGAVLGVVVERIDPWGQPASWWWEGDALRAVGVTRLRFAGDIAHPPLVNGKPWRRDARALPQPAKVLGQATGPLDGYARGPFVVVRGTGESAAAADTARTLAGDFLAAWVAHAQGAPPLVDDSAFVDERWKTHHLVLIGNARSNQVLARLVAEGLRLPASWDERSVTVLGQEFLRGEGRAFALAWPHPHDPRRLLVILDGAPCWHADGKLPLAGLPDLVVGAPRGGDGGFALRHLFDSDWR